MKANELEEYTIVLLNWQSLVEHEILMRSMLFYVLLSLLLLLCLVAIV